MNLFQSRRFTTKSQTYSDLQSEITDENIIIIVEMLQKGYILNYLAAKLSKFYKNDKSICLCLFLHFLYLITGQYRQNGMWLYWCGKKID